MNTIYRGFDITQEPLRGKYVVRKGGENTRALFIADSEAEAMDWIDKKKRESR